MGQPTHGTVGLALTVLRMRRTGVGSPARAEIQPPSSHAWLPCELTCALQQRPGTRTGKTAPWTQRKGVRRQHRSPEPLRRATGRGPAHSEACRGPD